MIQSNRLQCLNGAYFSEFTNPLVELLLQNIGHTSTSLLQGATKTGEIYRQLKQRIGQAEFSDNVKRNFNYECCFPGCQIKGKGFLVGGHIARWADNEKVRGATGNGLCLCLIHDKAFENGFFTVKEDYCIKLIPSNIQDHHDWIRKDLEKGEGFEIKSRQINPFQHCLQEHWSRVGYSPNHQN